MRSICDMDTVQIEITNYCTHSCSNCSRFCPHVKQPYYMHFEQFKQAVDSMVGYPKMTGIQGGEPLLHPQFTEMCKYLLSKIPKGQLGLWTTLPKGFEHYREIICETFGNIFLNDHTRKDIYHHPPLVAIREIEPDENKMWQLIDHCWAQESWSASINPKGAWFCEIAASLSTLFNEGHDGWPVQLGWWNRLPRDFGLQMDRYCRMCGFAAPLSRRSSVEQVDDISPGNYKLLEDRSRNPGRFKIHDLSTTQTPDPLAAYKDTDYRNGIAARYGMFVLVNELKFWTPYLKSKTYAPPRKLLEVYEDRIRCGT